MLTGVAACGGGGSAPGVWDSGAAETAPDTAGKDVTADLLPAERSDTKADTTIDQPPSDGGTGLDADADADADALADTGTSGDASPTTDARSDAATCPPIADGGSADAPPVDPVPDQVTFIGNVAVTTLAGGAASTSVDGPMATASFANPVSVIIEPAGSILVCDYDGSRIRRIAPDGSVTTLTAQANFHQPFGMAYGANETLYVGTDYNPSNQKDPTTGTIWSVNTTTGVATPMKTGLGRTRALALLAEGQLVFSNYQTDAVNLFDPDTGAVTLLAGVDQRGCGGFADGQGRSARFNQAYGLVIRSDGRIVMADHENHRLRILTMDGAVATYAGNGGDGTVDGAAAQARFSGPKTLAIDGADNIFVSDDGAHGHRIRRVAPDGTVTTVAGDGTPGWKDGTGAEARFWGQEGIAVTTDGKTVYVADGSGGGDVPYNRVRKIVVGP